jgi:hypothetical protein
MSRGGAVALVALALLQPWSFAVVTSKLPSSFEDTGVTKCTYKTPTSPQTPEYYERAWSVEASNEPWKWPITASATSPVSVVNRSHYARVLRLLKSDACQLPSHVLNTSIDKVSDLLLRVTLQAVL